MENNNRKYQQGSTFDTFRTVNTNPILERILNEQTAVKKIIYNTIECRNVRQSSFLNVDDIFQDICLLAMDYEKIARRANKLNTHFYGSMKMFAIDCVLKEQRRLNKFKAKSSKKKLYLSDNKLVKSLINTNVFVKIYNEDLGKNQWIEAILLDMTDTYFIVKNESGIYHINEGNIYTLAIGWAENKRLSHATFSHRSDTWLTIQQTLSAEDFEIFTLYYSGFTIAEVSEKIGKACQYAITKIKKQLAIELNIQE